MSRESRGVAPKYFPNGEIRFKGQTAQVTRGGTFYQNDGNSLRRLGAIWLPKVRGFNVEMLSGDVAFVTVVDGTLVVTDPKQKDPGPAPGSDN